MVWKLKTKWNRPRKLENLSINVKTTSYLSFIYIKILKSGQMHYFKNMTWGSNPLNVGAESKYAQIKKVEDEKIYFSGGVCNNFNYHI